MRAAPRALDTVEVLLGVVLVVVAAMSLAGIALAEAGRLSTGTILGAGGALTLLFLGAARWSLRGSAIRIAPTSLREWIALGVLVIGASALFRPPADALIEGGDGSVYLAIGRMIASTGGLRQTESTLSYLPADTLPELFSTDQIPPARLNYFPGGIQIEPDGRVEPNFFHLAPIWMAILEVLFGPRAPLYVNPAFGVVAVALVFALGRRLSGTVWAGLAAGAFVVVNFAEIWFARFPTTEILTQALALATLLLLLILVDGGPVLAAVVAGATAGLMAFCRVDAMLMVTAPLLAIAAVLGIAGDRSARAHWLTFLIVGGAITGYAVLHAWIFSGAYTERVLNIAFSGDWKAAGDPKVPAAFAAAVIVVWLARSQARMPAWAMAVAGLAVAGGVVWVGATAGARLVSSPFFLVLTPVAAVFALGGLVSLFVARQATRAMPLSLVFLVSAFAFLQSPRDLTVMPLLLRRFVPVLLPIGSVLAAHALSRLTLGPVKYLGRLAAATVAVLLIASSAGQARVLVAAPAYQGTRVQVERIAAAIPSKALTIFDPHSPSHLALAMRYNFGRDSLAVTGPHAHEAVGRAARAALDQGRRVFLAIPPGRDRPDSLARADFDGLAIRPVGDFAIQVATFQSDDAIHLPQAPRTSTARIDLYEAAVVSQAARVPIKIDVGTLDFDWLLSGFHGPEMMQGATVRWTDGGARVIVPPLLVTDNDLALRCRLAAPVPMGVALPSVAVDIDGIAAGSFRVTSGELTEYQLMLPRAIAVRLRDGGVLTVRTPTFVPTLLGASEDHRRLGVAIDWITLGL